MNRERDREIFSISLPVYGMSFLLGIWGLLTICSSQSHAPMPLLLAGRQFVFLLFSMAAMFACSRVPFSVWSKYLRWAGRFFFILLLLLPYAGLRINGMAGWFRIGAIQFQPSELAKGIYLFSIVSEMGSSEPMKKKLLRTGAVGAGWIFLIVLQPDMGTALIYFGALAAILFLAGAPWKVLLASAAAMAGGMGVFLLHHQYAWRRFSGYFNSTLDPAGSNWHLRQFELTISRGEFFGTKLGNAVWSNSYLPLPYNDSALATMFETLGFLGAIPCIVFFVILIGALLRLSNFSEPGSVRSLYVKGCAYVLALQSLIHFAVNVALIPATGLTLPWISYGGSSLLGSAIMTGIALSAANGPDRNGI